jgi:3-oxoacyl-[acyl-carrier protein] reductase
MESKRKVVLITGAGRGLGRHMAEEFLNKGFAVVVNYLQSEASAQALVAGREAYALSVKADIRDAGEVKKMIVQTADYFGRLDIVINNAGVTRDNLLLRQTEDEWDEVIRTNLTGCFNVLQAAAPLIIKTGGGHIINISSYSGIKGKAGQPAYSASKAALIGLTLSASRELAEHNIRVNAVLPGYMMTAMGSSAMNAAARAKEESIMHTLSDPSEAARCIVALSTLSGVTGQVISLDSRIL